MFAPHPGKTRTLKNASTWLLGCHATSARKSLEQKSINDHMITLSLPERAAIHCICWIFSRIMSSYFREELNWESISWKIERDTVNCPEWLRMIIMTLNSRNNVYDYIEQGRSLSEDTVPSDSDLLSDYSSYLALTRLERYHHVHRLCDSKWISFCNFFNAASSVLVQSIFICIWVFTRSTQLLERFHQMQLKDSISGDDADLNVISHVLQKECSDWKTRMDPRSRDYALNTSSLEVVHSRWILRAVWVVFGFLQNPIRSPELAAQFFRSRINHFGGFICQHLVWTLQLLGIVDIEIVFARESPTADRYGHQW